MITFPNAKINIGLFVTSKRPDNYHSIESIFYPVNIKDALEIGFFENSDPAFTISGNAVEGNTSDNLILKACREIEKSHPEAAEKISNLKIYLHKIIPTGAGLGGGSSDGSFALKMLNDLLQLNLSQPKLEEMALHLGSDCPFFIENKPALVEGRGEKCKTIELDLSSLFLVLIHPGIHISTAMAYGKIIPQPCSVSWSEINRSTLPDWKNRLKNDFEKPIFESYPDIKNIKTELEKAGAVYTQMSGSGSAVYGIFEKNPENIANLFPSHYSVFTCEL